MRFKVLPEFNNQAVLEETVLVWAISFFDDSVTGFILPSVNAFPSLGVYAMGVMRLSIEDWGIGVI